jgi:hypothetical protein
VAELLFKYVKIQLSFSPYLRFFFICMKLKHKVIEGFFFSRGGAVRSMFWCFIVIVLSRSK